MWKIVVYLDETRWIEWAQILQLHAKTHIFGCFFFQYSVLRWHRKRYDFFGRNSTVNRSTEGRNVHSFVSERMNNLITLNHSCWWYTDTDILFSSDVNVEVYLLFHVAVVVVVCTWNSIPQIWAFWWCFWELAFGCKTKLEPLRDRSSTFLKCPSSQPLELKDEIH